MKDTSAIKATRVDNRDSLVVMTGLVFLKGKANDPKQINRAGNLTKRSVQQAHKQG